MISVGNPCIPEDYKLIQSDYGDYLVKLTHISQSCRLQLREEGPRKAY